ncbi:MAG: metal ABC transporter ATP-binding protein [Candidatus Heimdallarchaeota archaeon]
MAIEVSNLTVAYRDTPVLWDVSFSIPKTEFLAIVGPNGAGKSTLIKAILGLIKPVAGSIKVFGKDSGHLPKKHQLIGYVPQRGSVDWDFPTNCLDVVMMGRYGHLGWFRRPGKHEKKAALEALEKFGLKELAMRQISQLSGGQQQRVFLARAYVQDADIYFLDEPFAGVDAKTEKALVTLLQELTKKGKTIIAVQHDLQTLAEYFSSVMLLNRRKIAIGITSKVLTPENIERTYGGTIPLLKSR